jgi:hypothetical protein
MWSMSDHDSFEERLRAIADEISRSMQRISEVDMEELSQRYGVDAERARAFADAAGQWLNDHLSPGDPLFGQTQRRGGEGPAADPDLKTPPEAGQKQPRPGPGPHPLDPPTDQQGVALSALDSGRWTVRPGSHQLAGSGPGAGPAPSDVVGDMRARDWITADGTLTLVGRHALGRWCRAVEAQAPPEPDVPQA